MFLKSRVSTYSTNRPCDPFAHLVSSIFKSCKTLKDAFLIKKISQASITQYGIFKLLRQLKLLRGTHDIAKVLVSYFEDHSVDNLKLDGLIENYCNNPKYLPKLHRRIIDILSAKKKLWLTPPVSGLVIDGALRNYFRDAFPTFV